MPKIRGDNEFSTACIKAAGLDPREVRRIIIDMPCDGAMLIYVEMYGTDRFYSIVVPSLTDATIEILQKEEK